LSSPEKKVTATRFEEVGNVGSPESFTASLRVEDGEQVMAELWMSFDGQRRSEACV